MPVGEPHPLRGQPINVRRRDLAPLRVVAPHISVAEIVGQNDDDVRLGQLFVSSVQFGQRNEQQLGKCEGIFRHWFGPQ